MSEQLGQAAPDFLGRLIERARGDGSGLRPRLPSLFEPTRYADFGMTRDTEATRPNDDAVGDVSRTVRDDTGTEAPQVASVPESHRVRKMTSVSEPQREPGHPSEVSVEALRGAVPALIPAPRMVLHSRPNMESPVATQHRDVGSLLPPEARFNRTTTERSPVPESVRPGAPVDEAERGRATHGVRPPRAEAGALLPSSESAARRVVVEAQTTRRRPIGDQEPPADSHAATETVINVTIGRVEVRAVQAAPVTRRAETQGPRPLSLDEYLKQRGGRR